MWRVANELDNADLELCTYTMAKSVFPNFVYIFLCPICVGIFKYLKEV